MSIFEKFKSGLSKTSAKLSNGISSLISKKKLDDETLETLEEILISTDIGISTTENIISDLAKEKFDKEVSELELKEFIAAKLQNIFKKHEVKNFIQPNATTTILVCGVNGNGKTTSIGKLAKLFQQDNKTVMLAACDTYRAAAIEQLKIWADRNNCECITGEAESDPASVAYQALERAKDKKVDILLIDSAGRLQNNINLMNELGKIPRVLNKLDSSAPNFTILVLDATTGQNAHSQFEKFNDIVKIDALIITKLDGTSKAGVAVSLAEKYNTPIYAIGLGEKIDDLQFFCPESFIKNLLNLPK